MLKIQRKANGEVVLTLSGDLEADSLSDLSALLGAEATGRVAAVGPGRAVGASQEQS
jgi:hypothetical protein